MEYVHNVTVDISDRQLFVGGKTFPVVINPERTQIGIYEIDGVYLNALLETPSGVILHPSDFGGIIIDLKNTDIALHSWKTINPGDTSGGCVRLEQEDILDLISNYYFNQIIIKH